MMKTLAWFLNCLAIRGVKFLRYALAFVVVFSSSVSMHAFADEDLKDAFSVYEDVVLSEEHLSQLRGGFVTSDGIEINVGIEKIALLNGVLQSWLAMDLSNISHSSVNVGELYHQAGSVVQSGNGNFLSQDLKPLLDSGALDVIQNTLDGQKIQNLTELNIDVSNIKNFHLPDLGRMIDFQVTQSLGSVR